MELTKESRERICGKKLLNNLPDDIHVRISYLRHNLKGRRTVAWVTIDSIPYYGNSTCSLNDMFCKETGRKIAIIRACRSYWYRMNGIKGGG